MCAERRQGRPQLRDRVQGRQGLGHPRAHLQPCRSPPRSGHEGPARGALEGDPDRRQLPRGGACHLWDRVTRAASLRAWLCGKSGTCRRPTCRREKMPSSWRANAGLHPPGRHPEQRHDQDSHRQQVRWSDWPGAYRSSTDTRSARCLLPARRACIGWGAANGGGSQLESALTRAGLSSWGSVSERQFLQRRGSPRPDAVPAPPQLTEDWGNELFSALKGAKGRAYSNYAVGYNNVDVKARGAGCWAAATSAPHQRRASPPSHVRAAASRTRRRRRRTASQSGILRGSSLRRRLRLRLPSRSLPPAASSRRAELAAPRPCTRQPSAGSVR